VYGGRGRRTLLDMYEADHAEDRRGGRFRWLMSTCLAATVGAVAIGIVVFGSLDQRDAVGDVPSVLRRLGENPLSTQAVALRHPVEGLRWAVPKSARLQPASASPTIRQIIHEQIQVRRNGRPYNQIRPYVRIVTRLQPVPARNSDVIPAFNPFTLYGDQQAAAQSGSSGAETQKDFRFQVIELLGATIPVDDGQAIDEREAVEIVERYLLQELASSNLRTAAGSDGATTGFASPVADLVPPNTTVARRKLPSEADDDPQDLERQVRRIHTLQRGETLARVLRRFGGDAVQVNAMLEAMRQAFKDDAIAPGLQLHVTLVPSLTTDDLEPARFSLFTEAGEHKVSVMRNSAGEFVASTTPFSSTIARAALAESEGAQASSIYESLYNAALVQGMPSETILQNLRIHAYDTDYRRRIRPGDLAEYFFDLRDDSASETAYGELLYTSLAIGGEIHRYWRFRAADGTIDYYDENGNNSKKFLLRRPVRSETVRLASGFGLRYHPILRYSRPHNGIDWAAPTGTPIIAAGNGVIEEAKYRGEFGNYIRIRHANGYHTAYAHMSRFAPTSKPDARVRQGQVIGYIGNTGLSAGPHLHFEVLVNSRPVNPLSIQVPRERQLTGKALADYQRERARIDELMRRQPVTMAQR
jgi:murein DD-endopeptidase MepM/ murein hydrolase activator NlpD